MEGNYRNTRGWINSILYVTLLYTIIITILILSQDVTLVDVWNCSNHVIPFVGFVTFPINVGICYDIMDYDRN